MSNMVILQVPAEAEKFITPGSVLETVTKALLDMEFFHRPIVNKDRQGQHNIEIELFVNQKAPFCQYTLVFNENGDPLTRQKSAIKIVERIQKLKETKVIYEGATDDFRYEKPALNTNNQTLDSTIYINQPEQLKEYIKARSTLEQITNSLSDIGIYNRFLVHKFGPEKQEIHIEIFLPQKAPVQQYTLIFNKDGKALMRQKEATKIIERLEQLAATKEVYQGATDDFRYEKPAVKLKK